VTEPRPQIPSAVLFDRDGTLVVDVPYNRDPALVEPMPTAVDAVRALRVAGIPVGVVSNQSGLARGLITPEQLHAVNARVEEIFGPFDTWQVCPHAPDDGCPCRKPRPGLVLAAARALAVPTAEIVVIGDIGADLGAAANAGARGVLVPTPVTRREEIEQAAVTAATLADAVAMVLDLPLSLPSPPTGRAESRRPSRGGSPQASRAESPRPGRGRSLRVDLPASPLAAVT
jgi:D-glycero-D-manno-heptose 1,7-bisphosphate phosphatase